MLAPRAPPAKSGPGTVVTWMQQRASSWILMIARKVLKAQIGGLMPPSPLPVRLWVFLFYSLVTSWPRFVTAECVNRADVVFVLDSSGSIDKSDFGRMLNFVSQLVDIFDIDGGNIRVGVVTFADDVQPAFNLSQYSSRQAVQVRT